MKLSMLLVACGALTSQAAVTESDVLALLGAADFDEVLASSGISACTTSTGFTTFYTYDDGDADTGPAGSPTSDVLIKARGTSDCFARCASALSVNSCESFTTIEQVENVATCLGVDTETTTTEATVATTTGAGDTTTTGAGDTTTTDATTTTGSPTTTTPPTTTTTTTTTTAAETTMAPMGYTSGAGGEFTTPNMITTAGVIRRKLEIIRRALVSELSSDAKDNVCFVDQRGVLTGAPSAILSVCAATAAAVGVMLL
eukprot:INCI6149.20.p1 GENE.INCI6149.20~~INCI6149.20.p1  ORF type:complete len:258 (+),score=51.85 INCI6149.20:127-900(+)